MTYNRKFKFDQFFTDYKKIPIIKDYIDNMRRLRFSCVEILLLSIVSYCTKNNRYCCFSALPVPFLLTDIIIVASRLDNSPYFQNERKNQLINLMKRYNVSPHNIEQINFLTCEAEKRRAEGDFFSFISKLLLSISPAISIGAWFLLQIVEEILPDMLKDSDFLASFLTLGLYISFGIFAVKLFTRMVCPDFKRILSIHSVVYADLITDTKEIYTFTKQKS